jgi:hypothetical protein
LEKKGLIKWRQQWIKDQRCQVPGTRATCRRRQLRRTETGMPVPAVERLALVLITGGGG